MPKKRKFMLVDVLTLYFVKAMSENSAGAIELLRFLFKEKSKDVFLMKYNRAKFKSLLHAQLDWLKDTKLTYYDNPEHATTLHKITKKEIKKKEIWLENIKKEHGESIEVRPFTDIEKAYLEYS